MAQTADPPTEPKKKRRVTIAPIDACIEAEECIEIYLVLSKDEAQAGSGHLVDSIDVNHFFGDEGKIYGYQGLKIVVWVNSVSFKTYVDIKYESKSDRGKGVTDLTTVLKDIFGENIVEKDEFMQSFATEKHFIRSAVAKGETLWQSASNINGDDGSAGSPNLEVIRLVMGEMSAGLLYSRLVPLVLLLVDGSNPIDVMDSHWEMYLLIEKVNDEEGDQVSRLLGFAAAYRFYHYPDSLRLRLSQILVLPPYQKKGHGRRLVELLNNLAVSENLYDLTVEEPSDSLQHIRYCIDIPRLLACPCVQEAVQVAASHLKETNLSKRTTLTPQLLVPPPAVVEDVRKTLKINKKEFTQCWDILIYLALDQVDKHMENYRIFITDRVKVSVVGRDTGTQGKQVVDTPSEYGEAFVMYKAHDSNEGGGIVEVDEEQKKNQEQQLQELVEMRINEIKEVAQKVSVGRA